MHNDTTPTADELARDVEEAHRLARAAFDRVNREGLRLWEPAECAAVASALATSAAALRALRTEEAGR